MRTPLPPLPVLLSLATVYHHHQIHDWICLATHIAQLNAGVRSRDLRMGRESDRDRQTSRNYLGDHVQRLLVVREKVDGLEECQIVEGFCRATLSARRTRLILKDREATTAARVGLRYVFRLPENH